MRHFRLRQHAEHSYFTHDQPHLQRWTVHQHRIHSAVQITTLLHHSVWHTCRWRDDYCPSFVDYAAFAERAWVGINQGGVADGIRHGVDLVAMVVVVVVVAATKSWEHQWVSESRKWTSGWVGLQNDDSKSASERKQKMDEWMSGATKRW